MRLTYIFSARVSDDNSDAIVSAPDRLDGRKLTEDTVDKYLDRDLADLGVLGGEIRLSAKDGEANVVVTYWLPGITDEALISRLQAYTVAQLDDGIGEGGFQIDSDGERLLVTAYTDWTESVEATDDGRPIPDPPRIAIAARDGELWALAAAIEADKSEIDRLHQGYSALQLAILNGHSDAIPVLLSAGANPNQLDSLGSTPLELCALSNSLDDDQSRRVAQFLIDAGATPNHTTPNGETAKSYALLRQKSRMAEIL